jgi:hypothetical protein
MRPSLFARLAPALCALSAAALLLAPADSLAFVKTGNSLDTTLRHFRLFNNLADPQSNDNLVPDSQYPGALGAEQAVW